MIVFRLSKEKHPNGLSGTGAESAGGRWNSRGISMVYASQSRALCTAEVTVNIPLGTVPGGFEMLTIFIPDDVPIKEIHQEDLPQRWRLLPFDHQTQIIGDHFIRECEFLVMKVPSAVVHGDFNFLINPRHPEFPRIEIIQKEPYLFDERFFIR